MAYFEKVDFYHFSFHQLVMNKKHFSKKHQKNEKRKEIIYGKNACFGCIQGYKNGIKNREIYEIYMLQNKFDDFLRKIPQSLRNLIKKCNSHELFSITHEQDKHQGIALKVSNFNFLELEDLINEDNKIEKKAIFLLEEIQDPQNVGSIIRSSFCFNIDGIILTEHSSCRITSAVVRASAGYSECSRICQIKNTILAIEKLKKNGYWIIGFDVNTNTQENITEIVNKYDKCVFIFGSEGKGIKDSTKKKCDIIVRLPMNKQAESLNVANTASIIGWEIMKSNLNN